MIPITLGSGSDWEREHLVHFGQRRTFFTKRCKCLSDHEGLNESSRVGFHIRCLLVATGRMVRGRAGSGETRKVHHTSG